MRKVKARARRRPASSAIRQELPELPVCILGGDLSLTGTGVAIYVGGEIATDRWETKLRGVARLAMLRHKLQQEIQTYLPVLAGVEGYAYKATSRAHAIGEWGGAAKLELMEHCQKCFIIPPATLKMFITEDGGADKAKVGLHLRERYGISTTSDDEADAACVSIVVGAHQYGELFPDLTSIQIEALKGVELMT